MERNLNEKKTFWISHEIESKNSINGRKIIRVNINYGSYIHLSRKFTYILKLHR